MTRGRKRFRELFLVVDKFLSSLSSNQILAGCLIFAIVLGFTDMHGATGLLIVYIFPMALAAWYGGRREGNVVAIYCAVAWYLAGAIATKFEVDPAQIWAFCARLTIFLVLTTVIASLKESMRRQEELTQFIVHDLRSPISSSITGLQTLQELATNFSDIEQEMVSLALVSNQRALGLVNSMLDVAKLESGSMSVQKSDISLRELANRAFDQVALWAKAQDIELVLESQIKMVNLDPELTERVIVNLLSNALKFSPPRSQIKVVVQGPTHGIVRFSVEDTGPGIPPEFLGTIFQPFSQVKGTKGGTGLGLTFCRLTVQAQGGKIWVESVLGEGTHMIFTLPAESQAREVSPEAPKAQRIAEGIS